MVENAIVEAIIPLRSDYEEVPQRLVEVAEAALRLEILLHYLYSITVGGN